MGFPRQPDDDVDQDQDPLSRFSAPTIRRSSGSTDRGSTQPLEEPSGLPRGSGMQVDGADFAGRSQQRRQRQPMAQAYTQRFGEMTQRFNIPALPVVLGAILILLALLLVWRLMSRNDTTGLTNEPAATADTAADTTPIFNEPANAFSTPGALDPGTGIGTVPVVVPTVGVGTNPVGGTFVVVGTGTEGLFLRSDANSSGNVVATLPEGTEVQATGEETSDGTRTWKKVTTPQGEGWVAADFVAPKP